MFSLLNLLTLTLLLPAAQSEVDQQPKLVLQNAYVSVYRAALTAGTAVPVPHPRKDIVAIYIDKDGSPRVTFLPGGANNSVKAEKNEDVVLVELQHHWDAEMKRCTFPASCVRAIRMGGTEIGFTESLFTNGFLSAYRHRIDAGGTLSSSYYSAKGKDRIVVIPLTNLHGSFDGTEEDLKPQQGYFSEAKEVEITGGEKAAQWIVIRLNTPRGQE